MNRPTLARVRRRLLLVVGRGASKASRLDGPPLAGWQAVLRPNGTRWWLRCYGRTVCRYTEPRVYREARLALSPSAARDLHDHFFYGSTQNV